jgi:hypothetical protein
VAVRVERLDRQRERIDASRPQRERGIEPEHRHDRSGSELRVLVREPHVAEQERILDGAAERALGMFQRSSSATRNFIVRG